MNGRGRRRTAALCAAALVVQFDEAEGPEPIGAGIDVTCTFHTQLGQVGTMTVSQEG